MKISVKKVRNRTHIMNKLAFRLRHGGQNLYPLVRRREPTFIKTLVSLSSVRQSNFEYILSKGLLHQINKFSVMPGKSYELV